MRALAVLALLTLSTAARAEPLRVEFWHAMTGVGDTVAAYARDFNASQREVEIVPVAQGNYRELLPKLRAALAAGRPPGLVQLELTQWPALAAAGELTELSRAVDALPAALKTDVPPAVWRTGQQGGRTYALPWNLSVPVLMYNAGALRRAGVAAPTTWAGLEAGSRALATGGRRPLVVTPDAWTFEAAVRSRGGALVDEAGRPTLNSPEALEVLTQYARMAAAGQAQPRSLGEATRAAFDFARGQNHFVLASVANWTDARRLPFFSLGIAPFPCETTSERCAVPLGGGALAVPRGTPPAAQAGALAFWQFLMEPARLASWVQATAYVPPRRSVTPLLEAWYVKNPQLRAAHAQLSRAAPRPTLPAYARWTGLLEDAIGRAINGKATPKAALDEAQRQAAP